MKKGRKPNSVEISSMSGPSLLLLFSFKAGDDSPLLYLSFWERPPSSPSDVKFWFSDIGSGDGYSTDIMAIQNVESYYNKMATDYENSMFGWGYCMPEAIADALVKHGGLNQDAEVLDLGCGNGLCGQALLNRGVENLNGIDFSRLVIFYVFLFFRL